MDTQDFKRSLIDDEPEAYEALARHYAASTYRFAAGMLKDPETAEDAVQEAFVKVWKHRKKIDIEKPLKPWIFRILKNTILDILRKAKDPAFSQFDTEEGNAIEDTLADEGPLAHELFENAERAGTVTKALAVLSAYERSVISLRYEEEFTFEEIAEVLGKPMNTVKSSHRRALARLKEHLDTEAKG
jgi:RNA polymerase sigma-70 factor (ECF subfamily)